MKQSTKQAIAEAFKLLLESRTIDRITVKDIVAECGINRQTFYYHFGDIYDLLEWTLGEDLKTYLEACIGTVSPSADNWKGQIYQLYQFLHEHRKLILHAYDAINKTYYENFVTSWITPILEYRLTICPSYHRVPEEKIEFILQVYTWVCCDMILEWVEHGMPDEGKIKLQDILILVDGSLDNALEKFASDKN